MQADGTMGRRKMQAGSNNRPECSRVAYRQEDRRQQEKFIHAARRQEGQARIKADGTQAGGPQQASMLAVRTMASRM
jgi:hypothetical protein